MSCATVTNTEGQVLLAVSRARRALLLARDEPALLGDVRAALLGVGRLRDVRLALGDAAGAVTGATAAFPIGDGARCGWMYVDLDADAPALAPDEAAWLGELATDIAHRLREVRAAPADPAFMAQLDALRVALDHVNEGIFLMQGDSPAFTYVNQTAATSLGYAREELTGGMTVVDIDPDLTPEIWRELVGVMRERRKLVIESSHRARDGRVFPVEVSGNYFELAGKTHNMAITRDLSARRATEQALRASANAYRSLVESTPDLILRWNRRLERIYVNQGFARALGRPVEELLGRRFGEQHTTASSASLAAVEAGLERVIATGVGETLDAPLMTVEGLRMIQLRLVPEPDDAGVVQSVLGIGRDITSLKETERSLRSLTENSPDIILRLERGGRLVFANGALDRFAAPASEARSALMGALRAELGQVGDGVRESAVALPRAGDVVHFDVRLVPEPGLDTVLAIVRDVTAERRLEEQFRQAQKMEAVGRLAGGIAHDFNNMLAVICMEAALLEVEAETQPLRDGIRAIAETADRAANLTRQLLTFSRRQVRHAVDLDLGTCIVGLSRLLQRVLGGDVRLVLQLAPMPAVHADPGMMEQVLMNLAINARDAMPEGGTLTLSLARAEVDAAPPTRRAGSYVRLSVADTGSGIAADVLPRIFEPFFTTKEAGRGTGLGLASVLAIVEQHAGYVDVESVVGRGTTFHVLLPAIASSERRVDVAANEA